MSQDAIAATNGNGHRRGGLLVHVLNAGISSIGGGAIVYLFLQAMATASAGHADRLSDLATRINQMTETIKTIADRQYENTGRIRDLLDAVSRLERRVADAIPGDNP